MERSDDKSFFALVAVDDAGQPVAVPPLVPGTDVDRARYAAAEARRAASRAAFAD